MSPRPTPRVRAYVKNHNLGLEVPYQSGSATRTYLPDFILEIDDGQEDPLHLIVEIKGFRRENAEEKKEAMDTYWIPGVNNLGQYGRWAFAEFTDVYEMESGFNALVDQSVARRPNGDRQSLRRTRFQGAAGSRSVGGDRPCQAA